MEVIIPTEIGMPTLGTEIPGKTNAGAITKDRDMENKLKEAVVLLIALYQQKMMNLYNMCATPRTFQVGDLVLRRVFENTVDSFQIQVGVRNQQNL